MVEFPPGMPPYCWQMLDPNGGIQTKQYVCRAPTAPLVHSGTDPLSSKCPGLTWIISWTQKSHSTRWEMAPTQFVGGHADWDEPYIPQLHK